MATMPTPPSSTSAEVQALLAQADAAGAYVNPALKVCDGERGHGFFAAEALSEAALLLRLPLSLSVSPAEPLAALVGSGKCSRLLAVALTMLHELHVAQPRAPYFDLLAASPLPSLPSLWPDAAVAKLEGSSLLPNGATAADAAAAARATFENDVLPIMTSLGSDGFAFPPAVRTERLFAESLAWVTSRALLGRVNYEVGAAQLWPYLRVDGPPTADKLIMLPVFDLLNTSSYAAEICAVLSQTEGGGAGGGAIEIRSTRAISAGEEILITYGSHNSAELLRTYGIVETIPNMEAVVPRAPVRIDFGRAEVVSAVRTDLARAGKVLTAATADGRCAMLEQANRLPVCFTVAAAASTAAANLLPVSLLTLVQLLLMDEEEVAEWREAGCIMLGVDFLDEESLPHVIGSLLTLADSRLRCLPESRVEEANGTQHGDRGDPAAMARGLVAMERWLLDVAFKRAIMQLESEAKEEEDDDEDDDEEESDGEEEGEEEESEEEGEEDVQGQQSKRAKVA